jgi:hypothetical protein
MSQQLQWQTGPRYSGSIAPRNRSLSRGQGCERGGLQENRLSQTPRLSPWLCVEEQVPSLLTAQEGPEPSLPWLFLGRGGGGLGGVSVGLASGQNARRRRIRKDCRG